jgi:hypothetical protein
VARTVRHRLHDPNAEIERERFSHPRRPPSPAGTLNHNQPQRGIPKRFNQIGLCSRWSPVKKSLRRSNREGDRLRSSLTRPEIADGGDQKRDH